MNKNDKYQIIWKGRVDEYENSGLTMKAWCEKNQVKVHQLQYWRRKFKTNSDKSLELVPVNFNFNQSQLENIPIKIQVGKLSLEVNQGFNQTLLKEVMKVLMELC